MNLSRQIHFYFDKFEKQSAAATTATDAFNFI